LRLADQRALIVAAGEGPAVPVYVLDDETPKHRKMGAASRCWLHHSLVALGNALEAKGSQLILRRGRSDDVLADLAKEIGATRVHALHHYEPWWRNAERAVADRLDLVLHDGNMLAPPGGVTTGAGQPYKIFTPFWRALREQMPPAEPLPAPDQLEPPVSWPHSDDLDDWKLLPTDPDWASGFAEEWTPGEAGAADRLNDFASIAARYEAQPAVGRGQFSPVAASTFRGNFTRDRVACRIAQGRLGRNLPQRARLARLCPERHPAIARLRPHQWPPPT